MRRGRTVRTSFLLLALGASVLGAGLGGPVRAQEAAATGDTLFGSYSLEARGLGVQARYEIEGLLPGGSPVLDLTIPETLARFGSGPTGYGLASLAYPGGILVNLGSLLAQTGGGEGTVPDYPIKSEAFFPAGPVDAQSQAIGSQQVRTNELGVDALGTFPALDADPVISVQSVKSASRSSIEDGKAVSRTRVELGGIKILGGVIGIGTLVTDLVAVHDGKTGSTAGGTTAAGVTFLGLAAKLTEDGLVLDEAPAVTGVGGPLGGVLNPILEPLQQLTAPVQALLEQVLDQAVPTLDDVLGGAGIDLHLLASGEVTSDSGAAAFRSSGLSLGITYVGKEQTALQQLVESIPPELRPSLGPLPNPLAFLTENHIGGLTLGQGSVSALASAPFDTEGGGDIGGGEVGLGELPSFESPSFEAPAFDTPLPDLPPPATDVGLDGDATSAIASGAIPAAALILALLVGSLLFGLGSTRLADNVLAPVATSCPSGLDQPPSRSRQP